MISTDRWTCPKCNETTVVSASPSDTRVALGAVRDGHLCPRARRAAVIADLERRTHTTWAGPTLYAETVRPVPYQP